MEFTKSLLKGVLTLLNIKRNQQKTIPLKKTSEVEVTCYSREFWEYACDEYLDFKYVFQDFKEFF